MVIDIIKNLFVMIFFVTFLGLILFLSIFIFMVFDRQTSLKTILELISGLFYFSGMTKVDISYIVNSILDDFF